MIYLKSKGIIIFINRDLESIYFNMDNNRPLIKSKEYLEKLYSERVNKYIECSDYQIDNDNINETIEKILNIITKKN